MALLSRCSGWGEIDGTTHRSLNPEIVAQRVSRWQSGRSVWGENVDKTDRNGRILGFRGVKF